MGARVERTRMETKGRRDRESRAVARRRQRCVPARSAVALGAGPRRAPAERVRKLSRRACGARTGRVPRRRRVRLRRLAAGGAGQRKDVGGARSVSTRRSLSAGPRLATRDQSFTHVVIWGNVSESIYEAPSV